MYGTRHATTDDHEPTSPLGAHDPTVWQSAMTVRPPKTSDGGDVR